MILGTIGILFIGFSIFLYVVRFVGGDAISIEDREKYFKLSKKNKNIRSEEEERFVQTKWHRYYLTKVINSSFQLGIVLTAVGFLINYIVN